MYARIYVPILAKDYYIPLDNTEEKICKNSLLLVEMEEKQEDYCYFLQLHEKAEDKELIKKDWRILRKCTEDDLKIIRENRKTAISFRPTALEAIKSLNLNMALTDIQISFDRKVALITFTAEARVDFRELVRILAGAFKKKIQLLQIGARDRAKIIGGFGVCGRPLCCKNHLTSIPSVTMDAAREQNIAFKGPESLSGCCEKLKCCLNYEKDMYEKLKKLFPKFGSSVKFDNQEFVIIGLDILNKRLKLKSEDNYMTITLDEYSEKVKKK